MKMPEHWDALPHNCPSFFFSDVMMSHDVTLTKGHQILGSAKRALTHTQTGPILYPQLLMREGIMQFYCTTYLLEIYIVV